MSVNLCRWNGNEYAIVDPQGLNLSYSINVLGLITRKILPPGCQLEKTATYSLKQRDIALIHCINVVFGKYADNIGKICSRFEFKVEGEGIECCRRFKTLIQCQGLDRFETLNLSGLGIDMLPFHIGLFKQVKRLDLSNNLLRILPEDLLLLANLESINLRGNPMVDLPPWLKEKRNLTIETDQTEDECMAQSPAQEPYREEISTFDEV